MERRCVVGLDLAIADEVEVEVKKYESDLRYVFEIASHSVERTHHFVDALRSQSPSHISVPSLLVCPPLLTRGVIPKHGIHHQADRGIFPGKLFRRPCCRYRVLTNPPAPRHLPRPTRLPMEEADPWLFDRSICLRVLPLIPPISRSLRDPATKDPTKRNRPGNL